MNRPTHAPWMQRFLRCLLLPILAFILMLYVTIPMLINLTLAKGPDSAQSIDAASTYEATDKFNMFVTNTISNALDGYYAVEKVYCLSDSDQVAPEPNQELFGKTDDPSSLQWLFNKVHHRLDGQELMFSTDTVLMENTEATYYLDDTILAVTWKEPVRNIVFTFAEVKIEDPSQFRRFLSDGVYGSEKQYLTSQMATSVNAVVASAGDFYKYRTSGHVVYNGEVKRASGAYFDTCFIDENGDLLFTKAGDITDRDQLQKFVDDNHIRFSLCFGPILLDGGSLCVPSKYPVGEIHGNYSRSALCQLGPLHYLVVTANDEGRYTSFPSLHSFAGALSDLGIQKAYTLDGGQTATIVMNDQVINRVSYGAERYISDIIYFATAIPDHE